MRIAFILLTLFFSATSQTIAGEFVAYIGWTIQSQTSWDEVSTAECGNKTIIMGSRSGSVTIPRHHYVGGSYSHTTYDTYPYNNDGLEVFDSNGILIDSHLFAEGNGNISYLASISEASFLVSFNGIYICSITNNTLGVVAVTQESLPITLSGELSADVKDGIVIHDNGYITKINISNLTQNVEIVGSTASGFSQDNYVLNWNSTAGTEYQIQSSIDLTSWANVGSAIVGSGETMTWANHITNSQAFYRVVEQ